MNKTRLNVYIERDHGNRLDELATMKDLSRSTVRSHAPACFHATPVARAGFLDHRGRDGSTPAQRIRAAGYKNLSAVAENIAGGAMTAREVMDGWLASPGTAQISWMRSIGTWGLAIRPTQIARWAFTGPRTLRVLARSGYPMI